MLSFLRHARTRLRSALDAKGPVQFFVGNEAADADSCISPICAALIAHEAQIRASVDPSIAFVPVMPCRRVDWPLRREAAFLLAQGLSSGSAHDDIADALLYFDDDDVSAALKAASGLRLTLLDHNSAWGLFSAASPAVCEIIDHHCDRGAHSHVIGAARNISFDAAEGRGVGSTCTLVARRLLDASAAGAIPADLASESAQCLLGVILLDTIGLEEAAGKTTPEDRAAVRDLCALLRAGGKWTPPSLPAPPADLALDAEDERMTSGLFATLRGLRMDPSWWLSLSVRQACFYDYKLFAYSSGATGSGSSLGTDKRELVVQPVRIGVAALTIHLSDFMSGRHAASAGGAGSSSVAVAADRAAHLRDFVSKAAPDGIAGTADAFIMMSYSDGRRQLALWTAPLSGDAAAGAAGGVGGELSGPRLSAGQVAWLAAQLEALPLLQLRRISMAAGEPGTPAADLPLLLWEQGNTKASRKQVDPVLAETIARMPADV